jgi:hypothetical protein
MSIGKTLMSLRLIVLIIFLVQIPYAFGDDGLDVVFLIDQSGSMSGSLLGSKAHPHPNDGTGQRISAVQNAIIRFAEEVEGTPLAHRFSVIEFGSYNRLNVPLSDKTQSYNPAQPGAAKRDSERWAQILRPKHLGYTDTPGAMRAAITEFQHWQTAGLSGTRERKLLLITDGKPCASGPRGRCKPLWKMRTEIKRHARTLKQMGVDIWVIGLNDSDNYWDQGDGVFWQRVAGRDKNGHHKARLTYTAFPGITNRTQYIIDDWLNLTSLPLRTEEYHIRPYLKRVVFNINANKPGATLQIEYPNGLLKSVAVSRTSRRGNYTVRHVLENPAPGPYKLKKAPNSVYSIHVEEELASLTFLSPIIAKKNDQTRVVFQVMQMGGPLQELPGWPINKTVEAKVLITAPSGKQQNLPAKFEGNGKFVAVWTPTEENQHQIGFEAKLKVQVDNKGTIKKYDLIDNIAARHAGKITVDPPTPPLWLRLENPQPQTGLKIYPWTDKAPIKISLYEGNKRVTTLENLVKNPETWLRLEKMDKSGKKSGKPLLEKPLKVENGYFVDQLPIQLNNKINGEGWWYPSKLHLQVVAEPNRLPEGRELNGIWLPREVEDKRLNANPMTVADIDILYHWLLHVLIVVLLLLILVWLVVFYLWPILKIRSEDKGHTVNLLIYDGMDDPGAVAAKKLPITGKTGLKYDGQIRLPTEEGKTMTAEYFRIKRDPNPNAPQVTVRYRWQGEQKTHIMMLSGRFCKNLEGLPSGNYMIALGY